MKFSLINHLLTLYFIFQQLNLQIVCSMFEFSDEKRIHYRNKVKSMFYHAYNGYLDYAYPKDELKPITCSGQDTWGSFSLTLVDSLDMLLILGNETEFVRATELVIQNLDVERNMNISVFETNIRIIGGLLSAHMLSSHAQEMPLTDGWPCSGPLLDLAERFAQKLLPAFNTNTGMPYGTVNLRYGVNNLETPITCTAGIGTFILEFGTLSRLTGNPHYERVALRALDSLWASRSKLGLVGNHIDVQTGIFTATDSGIGAGVDSYFEYLVKGALLFQRPALMRQFYEFEEAINKHVRKEDWFMWVDKDKATVSLPIFQSLEAFWPGLLTLIGKVEDAARIMASYGQILRHLGLPPEFYNLPNQEPVQRRAAYPLRPEIAESLMYLHRATGDPAYLQMAAGIVDAIDQMARTKCGFATVRDVTTWTLEDRMESFFLAETTKYLYLIFDTENWMHADGSRAKLVETTDGPCIVEAGGWIFNTEAHPLDPGIIYCCSKKRDKDRAILEEFEQNIDLLALTGQFPEFNDEKEMEAKNGEINNKKESENANEKGIKIPNASENEPKQREIGLICPQECSTPADEPQIHQNLRQFWLSIYANYFQFPHFDVNARICWDLDGDGEEDEDGSEEHRYSNVAPDMNSLQSEAQRLDAVADYSLLKFKYFRPKSAEHDPQNDPSNFILLTSPNRPFERNFLGIGQIVPA